MASKSGWAVETRASVAPTMARMRMWGRRKLPAILEMSTCAGVEGNEEGWFVPYASH